MKKPLIDQLSRIEPSPAALEKLRELRSTVMAEQASDLTALPPMIVRFVLVRPDGVAA